MKIKDGYMLRKMNEMNIVVAVGNAVKEFNGYISLNETGTFLWEKLVVGATKEELLSSILKEYNIDELTAKSDIDAFLEKLKAENLLEE